MKSRQGRIPRRGAAALEFMLFNIARDALLAAQIDPGE